MNAPDPAPVQVKTFTTTYGGIARTLVTDVGVGPAFNRNAGEKAPPIQTVKALWDTGATHTALSARAVKALALKPTGMAKVTGVHGAADASTYLICLKLPNESGFSSMRVTGAPIDDFGEDCDLLIGMDVISRGDFCVTNYAGQTVLTFRTPSVERIDFITQKHSEPFKAGPRQGRNEKCACGSGKKFKHCCGAA